MYVLDLKEYQFYLFYVGTLYLPTKFMVNKLDRLLTSGRRFRMQPPNLLPTSCCACVYAKRSTAVVLLLFGVFAQTGKSFFGHVSSIVIENVWDEYRINFIGHTETIFLEKIYSICYSRRVWPVIFRAF